MTDEYSVPLRFASEITTAHGIRVSVTIEVPHAQQWEDIGELAEVAANGAMRARHFVLKARHQAMGTPPF